MIVYLTHPKHGTHIAYSLVEVEQCKANGWIEKIEAKPEEKRKRGRPKKGSK